MQLDSLRATTETKEITYRIAYGLRLTDMHRWGLYVSHPRNIRETEHPFPEPAMFLINPEGQVQVAEYSNSPFCRPDLRIMIEGERLSSVVDFVLLTMLPVEILLLFRQADGQCYIASLALALLCAAAAHASISLLHLAAYHMDVVRALDSVTSLHHTSAVVLSQAGIH